MEAQKCNRVGLATWLSSDSHPSLFATASTSETRDSPDQFYLRIYNFDWDASHKNLSEQPDLRSATLIGSTTTNVPFVCLQWSRFGQDTGRFPAGILAGGMIDGTVTLWDTQKIIDGVSGVNGGCVFAKMVQDKVPVTCMEFNEKNPNLLASGGRSLRLQDLKSNLKTGDGIFKPGASENSNSGFLSSLSWHPSIDGLIASADSLGNIVVWNLKEHKAIYNFKEPAPPPSPFSQSGDSSDSGAARQQFNSKNSIVWDLSHPTQFVLAGNDNVQAGNIRFWDLQHLNAPTKGLDPSRFGFNNLRIQSIKFSKHAPHILIALCNSGSLTICWDTKSEQIVSTIGEINQSPQSEDGGFVEWSPRLPYVFLKSQLTSGDVTIGSVDPNYGGVKSQLGANPALALSQSIPQPMRKKAGCAISSQGVAISFANSHNKGKIYISKPKFTGSVNCVLKLSRAKETAHLMQRFFKQNNLEGGVELMIEINSRQRNETELEEWQILKAITQTDPEKQRQEVIDALGLHTQAMFKDIERFIGKRSPDRPGVQQSAPINTVFGAPPPLEQQPSTSIEEASEFFSQLGSSSQPTESHPFDPAGSPSGTDIPGHQRQSAGGGSTGGGRVSAASESRQRKESMSLVEHISRNSNWNEGPERLIKQSLLAGYPASAVEVAFKCGRAAEAILIAKIGGDELFSRTLEQYFQHHSDPFIKYALKHIYHQDIEGFVSNHNAMAASMINWRESLILAVNNPNRKNIANQLANQLLKRDLVSEARICFMISGQFEPVAKLWMKDFHDKIQSLKKNESLSRPALLSQTALSLRDIVLKMWTLMNALHHKQLSQEFDTIVQHFVQFCLAGGEDPETALTLLELCNLANPSVASLYNRIYMSNPNKFKQSYQAAVSHLPRVALIVGNLKQNQPSAQQRTAQPQVQNPTGQHPPVRMRQPPVKHNPAPTPHPTNPSFINPNTGAATQPPPVKTMPPPSVKTTPALKQAGAKAPPPPVLKTQPPLPSKHVDSSKPNFSSSSSQPVTGYEIGGVLEKVAQMYLEIETNSSRKADTQSKLMTLKANLAAGSLSSSTLSVLSSALNYLAQGQALQAQKAIREFSSDSWQETKDWIPGIRTLISIIGAPRYQPPNSPTTNAPAAMQPVMAPPPAVHQPTHSFDSRLKSSMNAPPVAPMKHEPPPPIKHQPPPIKKAPPPPTFTGPPVTATVSPPSAPPAPVTYQPYVPTIQAQPPPSQSQPLFAGASVPTPGRVGPPGGGAPPPPAKRGPPPPPPKFR